ncbi:hypothetical protein BAG01nite_15010 [Brevibacillus agri]|uniref:Uncharacterized protein n=1 Tax=Brevibacillus agri TaxID=51101 RepID=A0A3M8B5U7_9BACL|nr:MULTISPECIES: hypothetical protein [Brevibacillus]ELK39832.1 hypothetical protein D478_22243 [Brevibacillus agri BAB-2500]EJL41263.1 hypothetical protein PMI08_03873 [Brevibacillus sp. CF112]MBG9568933.1 hypothetical protein [Brevibacillus agri]MCG5249743.1 hypothetical protein [Brevibacillus agri]MED3498190.1 hypothetical protein [Brevibacillus agri]
MDALLAREKDEFLSCIETIKELESSEFESYSIVKHTETGEHYLRYFLSHINLSEGGRRDNYDHFLPIDSDDVLGLMFGEQPYRFPENWRSPYLRSGNDNRLIPFDPSENYDLDEEAAAELAMVEQLELYKQQWMNAETMSAEEKEKLTKQYFAELDKILKKAEE